MGMTMTQKILAEHAGLESVVAGQLIKAKLDMVLGNDITTPVAVNEFEKAGFNGIFDREKISLVMDHFTPNKDIKAAEQCKQCRTFARRFDVKNFFDVGRMGRIVRRRIMEDVKWLLRRCGLPILLLLFFVIAGVICWGKIHEEEQKVLIKR